MAALGARPHPTDELLMPPIRLPIAEYTPDLPSFAGGSDTINNVVPKTPASYGPLADMAVFSGALTARCQGGAGFIDKNLGVSIFAGDATKLYKLTAADNGTWADFSGATYAIGSDSQWEFEYFNGSVIATDYVDAIQSVNLASGTAFADLAAAAPKARHMAVVKRAFLVVGNIFDASDGALEQSVQWSGAGDASSWPTPGGVTAAQVQSGRVNLFGNDGQIQAIRSGMAGADALIFKRYGITRMMYSGPPTVFEFLPAEGLRGTPAPYSPVVLGDIVYYLGFDGFYATDGVSSQPIGANKIDATFLADLDANYVDRVKGVGDPLNKLIIWAYPGAGNTGGVCNRLLFYNWQIGRWSISDSISAETIISAMGLGYTLDQLYTSLGYTLETLPAPLDSAIWAGGSLQVGLFDSNHKLNYLTGSNLAASIDTSEMQPVPGKRMFIRSARPLVDGGTPAVAIGHRERLQDSVTNTSAVSLNALGECPVRTSGRYFRAKATTVAGDSWTHFAGIELDAMPQGRR